MQKVGKIRFEKLISITDPCYDKDVWCRINNYDLPPDEYNCIVEIGERVKSISIISSELDYFDEEIEERLIGEIGVDAGLAGFFQDKPDFSDEEWYEFCDKTFDEGSEFQTGIPNVYMYDGTWKGVWSESGYGDGGYDVYELRVPGKVVGLRIVFIY